MEPKNKFKHGYVQILELNFDFCFWISASKKKLLRTTMKRRQNDTNRPWLKKQFASKKQSKYENRNNKLNMIEFQQRKISLLPPIFPILNSDQQLIHSRFEIIIICSQKQTIIKISPHISILLFHIVLFMPIQIIFLHNFHHLPPNNFFSFSHPAILHHRCKCQFFFYFIAFVVVEVVAHTYFLSIIMIGIGELGWVGEIDEDGGAGISAEFDAFFVRFILINTNNIL